MSVIAWGEVWQHPSLCNFLYVTQRLHSVHRLLCRRAAGYVVVPAVHWRQAKRERQRENGEQRRGLRGGQPQTTRGLAPMILDERAKTMNEWCSLASLSLTISLTTPTTDQNQKSDFVLKCPKIPGFSTGWQDLKTVGFLLTKWEMDY